MSRPTVRSLALATSICIACLPLPCGSAHANDSIKIGGTGAATELLRRLGSAFLGQGGIAVDVVPSLGSSGGISAVVDGAVAIDGIEPTFENFERGHYRYQKVLYFVTRVQVGATTERFVDFLRSAEGQRLLREAYTL